MNITDLNTNNHYDVHSHVISRDYNWFETARHMFSPLWFYIFLAVMYLPTVKLGQYLMRFRSEGFSLTYLVFFWNIFMSF